MQIVQDNHETQLIRSTILDTLRAAPGRRHRLEELTTILGTGVASVRAIVSQLVLDNQIRSERVGRIVSYFMPTAEQLAAEYQQQQLARPFKPYRHDEGVRRNLARAKEVRGLGKSRV